MILSKLGLNTTSVTHDERYNTTGHHVLQVDTIIPPHSGNDKVLCVTVPYSITEELANSDIFQPDTKLQPAPHGAMVSFDEEHHLSYRTDSPVLYVPFVLGVNEAIEFNCFYEFAHDVVEGWVLTGVKEIPE
jgi:hypothetical protein